MNIIDLNEALSKAEKDTKSAVLEIISNFYAAESEPLFRALSKYLSAPLADLQIQLLRLILDEDDIAEQYTGYISISNFFTDILFPVSIIAARNLDKGNQKVLDAFRIDPNVSYRNAGGSGKEIDILAKDVCKLLYGIDDRQQGSLTSTTTSNALLGELIRLLKANNFDIELVNEELGVAGPFLRIYTKYELGLNSKVFISSKEIEKAVAERKLTVLVARYKLSALKLARALKNDLYDLEISQYDKQRFNQGDMQDTVGYIIKWISMYAQKGRK